MTTARRKILVMACLTLLCGCRDSLETCVRGRVTVASGVYGQLFNCCDVAGCSFDYAEGFRVNVYSSDPTRNPGEAGITEYGTTVTPVASTISGDEGVFQIELAAGTYYLCHGRCIKLTLAQGELTRYDDCWPGWSRVEECYHMPAHL